MVPLTMCSSPTGILCIKLNVCLFYLKITLFSDVLFSFFYVYRVASDSSHAQMVYDQLTGNTMIIDKFFVIAVHLLLSIFYV